jgi:uncharacterized protein (TIGR00661 family)
MKIIYGICSWGLGHASRSLPIIRKLLDENHEVTIISHDRSLQLLENELNDSASFISIPDYPLLISENTRQFIAKSMMYWPLIIKSIYSGYSQLTKILEKQQYNLIISDGRYDMFNKTIPTYFISHQMRILNPLRIKILENGSETFNQFFFKRFKDVIIPDYETDNFSGDLSHNLKKINETGLHYVGILSDFTKKHMKKDIDYFISLSGPEPQRSILEEKIQSQINQLSGSIVMTLGKTEETKTNQINGIKTYSFLSKNKREDLLNRSKIVISRSGYSTILDLAVIGCKALMIPTPGQIEQEYLAQYHKEKKTCYTINQEHLNLNSDIEHVKKTKGFTSKGSVKDAVEKIIQIISN